jgi:uncharacterized membrane protein
MKNKSEVTGISGLYWILAVLPLIITLLVLPGMPNTVPAHYGFSGQVNRWGSKYELLIFPCLTIVLASAFKWLFPALIKFQSSSLQDGQKNSNQKVLNLSSFIVVAIFNVMTCIFLFTSYRGVQNIDSIGFNRMISVLLCLMYIIIGNSLPKCQPNPFIGIRVSWTLSSDEVWFRTHRFGGKVFMIGGFIGAVCSLLAPEAFALPITILVVLLLTAIVCTYAHHIFYKLKDQK